jgi:hypothetical protein
MDTLTSAAVSSASNATLGKVQSAAAISVLRTALDVQATSATQLLEALPSPALATSGSLGTLVNTYA